MREIIILLIAGLFFILTTYVVVRSIIDDRKRKPRKPDHIPDLRKKVNPNWCMNRFECNIKDRDINTCMNCELHFRNIQL